MKAKMILVMLVLLVGSFGVLGQETVTFETFFTGGLPFCSQCGTPGQYACSADANGITLGNWNNGVVSFTDPVPSGNYATQLVVTVQGAFSCNAQGARVMFGVSLNGEVHAVRDSSKGVNACKCDTCDGSEVFTLSFRNGVPQYRYKGTNTLQLLPFKDSLCVNKVHVAITYAAVQTSTPLPEVYFNLTIPREYDRVGCPVCNAAYNQWCSASNNNTLQLSFKDPLPSGVYLISADVYLSLNMMERAITSYSTVSARLQDTAINTVTINDANFKERCGCLGDYQFQSALYQRGWPGYVAAGVNRVSLTLNKYSQSYGNVCIGRLALKLVYYQYADDGSPVLSSLILGQDDVTIHP